MKDFIEQMNQDSNNQMPKEMPNMNVENSNSGIRAIHYIMFIMEGIIISILITYLVMSKFNKFTIQETLNGTSKVIIFGLIIIIITTALTLAQICIANKFFTAENSNSQNNQQMFPGENMNSSSNSVTKVGANEIDGTDETLTSSYTASESDESVILVENGGNVTLNADKQTLEGNIEIDNISNLTMNLNNSSYTGTINADNTAKEIILKLDSNSSITLTGDSYITSLEDSDSSYNNINFNGYKLYVNGIAIN